jgi:ribosome-binding factor A
MYDRNDRALSIIQELAATFIREEANTTPLITVTRVEASSDFHHVHILVSVFPESQEKDALIFLKRKGAEFREFVKKNGRFKYIPFFDFSADLGEKHRRDLDEKGL